MATPTSANAVALVTLCRLLNEKPRSKDELEREVGVCRITLVKWMRFLRNQKLIYIADYRRHSNGWTELWAWGFKQYDALKPKPMTAAESCRKWRQNKARLVDATL